jgi:hypothetical protein
MNSSLLYLALILCCFAPFSYSRKDVQYSDSALYQYYSKILDQDGDDYVSLDDLQRLQLEDDEVLSVEQIKSFAQKYHLSGGMSWNDFLFWFGDAVGSDSGQVC